MYWQYRRNKRQKPHKKRQQLPDGSFDCKVGIYLVDIYSPPYKFLKLIWTQFPKIPYFVSKHLDSLLWLLYTST